MWLKYLYLLFFLILLFLEPTLKGRISVTLIYIYCACFFLSLLIHFYLLRKDRNWFRIDVLFLLGFCIVHFQWPVMIAYSGIFPQRSSDICLYSEFMNYGTWLSSIGGLAWLVGYSYLPLKSVKQNYNNSYNYSRLSLVTVVIFVVFILTAGKSYLSGEVYRSRFGSHMPGGVGAYFGSLCGIAILVLTAFIILNSRTKYIDSISSWFIRLEKSYLLLFFLYILLFLSIGDRGAAIKIVLTFLVLFGQLVRPIKLKEFFIIVFLGAFILTIIGLGRGADEGESMLIAGYRKIELSSGYNVTLELASSARTLYKSLSHVPMQHDFFYGKLWLSRWLAVIPFSQRFYLEFTDDIPHELGSPSYITYISQGLYPTSGEGITLVADIYLNFGKYGVVFFLFPLGLFFKKIRNEMLFLQNIYWLVILAIMASQSLFICRASLFGMLRPITWGLFCAFIFVQKKPRLKT